MAITKSMWIKYGEIRKRTWLRNKTPLCPVDGMPEWVIPHAAYSHEPRDLSRIQSAFQRIDPDFRLIYDATTAYPGQPAYHLYTVEKGVYPGVGKLQLEFSIQRERGKEWPDGTPCVPDFSHVARAASSYKGRHAIGRKQVHAESMRRIQEQVRMLEAAKDWDANDLSDHLWKEYWEPYLVNGRVMPKDYRRHERGFNPNRVVVPVTNFNQAGGHWRRGKKGLWVAG